MDQNSQNVVWINNSRTVWPTQIVMLYLNLFIHNASYRTVFFTHYFLGAGDPDLQETPCLHCKYQRYILTRCSVNLLVDFNTMVLKRVFFVIINTCVALIWALMY